MYALAGIPREPAPSGPRLRKWRLRQVSRPAFCPCPRLGIPVFDVLKKGHLKDEARKTWFATARGEANSCPCEPTHSDLRSPNRCHGPQLCLIVNFAQPSNPWTWRATVVDSSLFAAGNRAALPVRFGHDTNDAAVPRGESGMRRRVAFLSHGRFLRAFPG